MLHGIDVRCCEAEWHCTVGPVWIEYGVEWSEVENR
jgi:hypothetical protein